MAVAPETEKQTVQIPSVGIVGDLTVPASSQGVIIFAHGSGSSRFSTRNQFVARLLQEANLSTLLLDLLTPEEEKVDLRTRHLRFDIELLANRLIQATTWVSGNDIIRDIPIGYFGASTGAAAALIAAAQLPESVRAVVSRGGRPDLAGTFLPKVKAPTLLIVGGEDGPVITLNKRALNDLRGTKQLEIVPGATHLFEEPGALEAVARLAVGWFGQHLSMRRRAHQHGR